MARKNQNMTRINFYLPQPVLDAYKKLAAHGGRAYSELIREDLVKSVKVRVSEHREEANASSADRDVAIG